MGVIFGALPAPPAAPVAWTGLAMKWIGGDGSEWSLSDSTDGTVMMPGVRGLTMPPIVHHRAAHASVPGARWRGLQVDVREAFWPLQVYSDLGSVDWINKDRAFWKSLDPERTGTWVVTTPDGQSRSIKLRFTSDGTDGFDHDVALRGWSNYGITLEAEQPFWEGEPVIGSWKAGSAVPFFTAPGGPSFTISPSGTLAEAQIANPGDVEAYMVWRVYGPTTAATVGINGLTITIPFAIPSGQVLEIDTSPSGQTALLGPAAGPLTTDMTGSLSGINFSPLPADSTSVLTLSVTGTGSVEANFTPRYYRAW